ncbi:MAG: accessory gene regulator B family protein [Roseburia sp.]|nr:accessory gene regulator B family protein [Roseburia sp.]
MKRLYRTLTDYIIVKGMAEESDREMYEYAFEVAMELGIFVLACIIITLCLGMFWEGVFFFIIFIPLRSYAGGLHMETYTSCFCMSCLAFSGVLLGSKYIEVPGCYSGLLVLLLEIMVYKLYPVEHVNRSVDEAENVYFKKKLIGFLLLDCGIVVVCLILEEGGFLLTAAATFLLIVFTMIAGKWKNKNLGNV